MSRSLTNIINDFIANASAGAIDFRKQEQKKAIFSLINTSENHIREQVEQLVAIAKNSPNDHNIEELEDFLRFHNIDDTHIADEIFPETSWGGLDKHVQSVLRDVKLEDFSQYFQKGHVGESNAIRHSLDVTNTALQEVAAFIKKSGVGISGIPVELSKDIDRLIRTYNTLNLMYKLLKKIDSISSHTELEELFGISISLDKPSGNLSQDAIAIRMENLLNSISIEEDMSLVTSSKTWDASKTSTSITLELKITNSIKGEATQHIKGLFKNQILSNLAKQSKVTLDKLSTSSAERLLKEIDKNVGNPQFLESLINGVGSPSHVSKIEAIILNSLDGKSPIVKGYTHNLLKNKKMAKVESTSRFSSKQTRTISKKPARIRNASGHFQSLISIKNLLNNKLAQQIQQNMGRGRATQVLNYRTGRFANSAEVTQVTNREGAITAFYTYMKNPYVTFAQGGRQSDPSSRDPNLLIQKSIRQLAQGIVTNRLKVVPQ